MRWAGRGQLKSHTLEQDTQISVGHIHINAAKPPKIQIGLEHFALLPFLFYATRHWNKRLEKQDSHCALAAWHWRREMLCFETVVAIQWCAILDHISHGCQA